MFKDGQKVQSDIPRMLVKLFGKESHFYWKIILLVNINIAVNKYYFFANLKDSKSLFEMEGFDKV